MCEKCGCGNTNHEHEHEHEHQHDHYGPHTHDGSADAGHTHSQDYQYRKVIDLNVDILAGNNMTAALNRRFLEGRKVLCINMVSSPGSGKTTILEKTVSQLSSTGKVYVIEGDQQTRFDSERIEKAGAPAIQINTGTGCHLDAKMVETALNRLDPETGSVLFIENVGNLVCPAMFDLGESGRVLVLSVTEGEDKPLKYPNMFETSHLCLINKSDLLPYVDFRPEEFIKNAKMINHHLDFIVLSAKTGEGMDKWYKWISALNTDSASAGR